MRRVLAVLLPVIALLSGSVARAAADDPAADFGGFRSVLGVGQGTTVNAVGLAQFEATGTVPPSFTNQLHQYSDVESRSDSFTAADLDEYLKNSGFGVLPGGEGSSESPEPGLTIVRDKQFSVPRIYGQTRSEVMFGAGYATAEDRLFLMDVLRHTAEGSLTDIVGPSGAAGDSAELGHQDYTAAEYTSQLEALPQIEGPEGAQILSDLKDYIAGINAYINAATLNPLLLPGEYPALGITPQPWTEADTAAVGIYLIAQFTVSGGGQPQDAQIMTLLQKEHPAQAQGMYSDFRRLQDPETPLVADRSFPVEDPGPPNPAAVAMLDPSSYQARNAVVSGTGSAGSTQAARTLPAWASALASRGLGLPPRESNALLVEGSRSASGHPLASMGPQVGYYSPEIFNEYELHGGGIDVSGVSFPGASPYPLIGHGRDFAWTGTTANGGNEDIFAEKLCNPDGSPASAASASYEYRGRCVAFQSRDQVVTPPPNPTNPSLSGPITLRALRSVHGPVEGYATVRGVPVALTVANATENHAAQSYEAFERLATNAVDSPQAFVGAFQAYTGNENWFYADDRDIAWYESGRFPHHATGSSREFPIWGTGSFDWQGFDPSTYDYQYTPVTADPTEIDPPAGYLASWNNKEVPNWPAPAGTWSFGPSERVQDLSVPLTHLLAANPRITLAQLVQISIQGATRDLRGETVLPLLLDVIGSDPGPQIAPLLDVLRGWEQDGSLRVDLTGKGYQNDSPAILLMDAWWPRLVKAEFEPALGADAFAAISSEVNPYDERPNDSGFFNGWQSYVDKDLRDLLASHGSPAANTASVRSLRGHGHRRPAGHSLRHRRGHHPRPGYPGVRQPFSEVYCGSGSLVSCRSLLESTLLQAAAQVTQDQGTGDMSQWRHPNLCPVPATGKPTCDEEIPVTAGAVATPPFPFQNRGTFFQADEILGHRPR